jgi:hypothetical protein
LLKALDEASRIELGFPHEIYDKELTVRQTKELRQSRNWPTASGKSAVALKGRRKRTVTRLNPLLINNRIAK